MHSQIAPFQAHVVTRMPGLSILVSARATVSPTPYFSWQCGSNMGVSSFPKVFRRLLSTPWCCQDL